MYTADEPDLPSTRYLKISSTTIISNCKAEKKKSPSAEADGLYKYSGDVLLSHDLAVIVSSALESLTSVFGMGTGVTSPV